ncbi:ATP-binding protein [Dyadobacter psychrotolerans]|uniref:histidine kinase n=1 Tax=Dyadobacter psychrotolerans TaxID=2541721 RepID=A0A4R5DTJ5_9BACT|nr:ATP-binding protein [Dyadobacter psychrotolerans]TDE15620.1 PAS domain-containing sensor histidine kinase [Dyadobacter psychrotolerans]
MMHQISVFNLENDQDIVLAHKRSMQLAEMCGLGLVAQTSLATAVSEIARFMIEIQAHASIRLSLGKAPMNLSAICASIYSPSINNIDISNEKFQYAKRLVNEFVVSSTEVCMYLELPRNVAFNTSFIDKCKNRFKNSQPISPYDEVKRKNAELQQMADSLLQSENRYQQLTNSLPLMMFILAEDGQMLYANEWFLNFTGKNLQSLNKTNWLNWLSVHHVQVDFESLRQLLELKQAFQQEVLLTTLDGSTVWHLLSLTPQGNDLKQENIQWFGFIVNIHAQKVVEKTLRDNQELIQIKIAMEAHEKQLDQTIQELNRSNQELARYAYVASHDLQEPTRKIILLSSMIMDRYKSTIPPEANGLLDRIKGSADRMQALVTDLLVYSRIDSGERKLDEHAELSDIVSVASENLEFTIREVNARINLNGSYVLLGNTIQLQQLFQNLIGNAVKFAGMGLVPVININAQPLSHLQVASLNLPGSDWLSIDVCDNGIGFDESFAERIFEVFQRLHSRTQYTGTGIGLSICKKIVELHGGRISVTSEEGKGSVFTLTLPYLPTLVNWTNPRM